jgi:hypothetical protein
MARHQAFPKIEALATRRDGLVKLVANSNMFRDGTLSAALERSACEPTETPVLSNIMLVGGEKAAGGKDSTTASRFQLAKYTKLRSRGSSSVDAPMMWRRQR